MANAASFNTYMDGVRLMQAGREQEAVSTWESLRTKDPSFPDSYNALATYYNNLGDAQQAITVLDGAKANHVDTPDLRLALAEAYVRLGDKRAMAAAKEAVKLEPNNYRSHLTLSTAYAQAFDVPHAMQELTAAQQLDSRDPVLYLLGAEYTATSNDYPQVEAQAQKAVELNPKLAEGWYYLGWAIESGASTDRLPEARQALEKAVQIKPEGFASWVALGETCWRLHDGDAALANLTKARALGATLPPGSIMDQKRLQDRLTTDHLLLEIYHSRNQTAREAEIRNESNSLSSQIQNMVHTSNAQNK